jgi:hypothetical protein
MESSLPTPPPSLALRVAVDRMLPVATRRPWRQAASVIGASLAATVGWIALSGVRGSWRAVAVPALMLVALFAARIVAASVPPRRTVLPAPRAPLAKTALGGAGALAAMLMAHGTPIFAAHAPLAGAAWNCFWRGTIAWAVPTVIATLVLQRVFGGWRVACEIAGATAALAALTLLVGCNSRDVAHVVVAHGGVVLLWPVFGVSAAAAGARWLIGR